ncbi:uncharacterized protein M6B38_199130 [Iris pallida]|uniref:Secreted protein n=1 Tax=Iris pallida TaxID=29817 RepID=A0AAX6EB23_IRIPA|nr:uncharacterized protein M6B38_199130 [Iris pallida]
MADPLCIITSFTTTVAFLATRPPVVTAPPWTPDPPYASSSTRVSCKPPRPSPQIPSPSNTQPTPKTCDRVRTCVVRVHNVHSVHFQYTKCWVRHGQTKPNTREINRPIQPILA